MAKGGNSKKSNGSRFSKPYDVSNSFVTKVASRVSDYLGGWFGSSKSSSVKETIPSVSTATTTQYNLSSRRPFESYEVRRPTESRHTFLQHVEDVEGTSSPAKRFKLSQTEKKDIDFPISPIPSTSGLLTSTAVNHSTFDVPRGSDDYAPSDPGPSSLHREKYSQTSTVVPPTTSSATDVKANGTTDNHSDSSESTSGCSSLVPQSDRLSQSAYACSSRKRTLEEKLKYARQLQQSRTSMFLNRSIPVSEMTGGRKKPSFDVTAYNSTSLDKSLLREKLINSPFYTGRTSYGGASAYRLSRNTLYSQKNLRNSTERRDAVNIEVKSVHQGSSESVANMSHTAKKILEALEQFSTPVNDAKRIPTNKLTPLGAKRKRMEESSESRMRLATPMSPLNPNPDPLITGLNVPTVPDLLKLKRLERIQNSTAAARQVAVEKQEYSLRGDADPPPKRTGKIVTKLKDKEKNVPLEKLEEVNLPKIPLPITTLPKFDFQLPPPTQTPALSQVPPNKINTNKVIGRTFKFSDPIFVLTSAAEAPKVSSQKNNFTFSSPLNASDKKKAEDKEVSSSLMDFMSSDAVAKLKRKSINDTSTGGGANIAAVPAVPAVPAELKTGSVMDFFKKSAGSAESKSFAGKVSSETWECGSCLIHNLSESKICCGCKAAKVSEEKERTLPSSPKEKMVPEENSKPLPATGFGDKFKLPAGSWSCKECFVNNKESVSKCIACESPKPLSSGATEKSAPPPAETTKPALSAAGFGDMFKKQANQWECSVCMIRNKESDSKCAACETPKPGAKLEKSESKFNFGSAPSGSGFLFAIEKEGVKSAADSSTFKFQSNGPTSESTVPVSAPSQFKAISTSVGVFTFGIPPTTQQDQKDSPAKSDSQFTDSSNSRFMVTSTSGSGTRKDESVVESERAEQKKDGGEAKTADKNEMASKAGSEGFKSFIFDASNKSSSSSFFGVPKEEGKDKGGESDKKPPTFFFGANANTMETVSSSTTDFTFRSGKSTTSQLGAGESPYSTVPFQFKPFVTAKKTGKTSVASSNLSVEANEAEVKPASSAVSTSVSVTTSAPVFGSTSIFFDSNSKMSFGTTSTSSSNKGFTSGSLRSGGPFSKLMQSFGSSGFGSRPLASSTAQASNQVQTSGPNSAPATAPAPAFGMAAPAPEKPVVSAPSAFGNSTGTFGTVPNPFASALKANPESEPPKAFGSLGSGSSGVSVFGTNPAPTFGSSFMQPSASAEKPAPQPFIFGNAQSSSISTTAPTPGVFTFGASKPSQFSFGQQSTNNNANFSFGSNAPSTNIFGSFGQSKPDEAAVGGGNGNVAVFGNPAQMFGQSSAPPAFGSTAPKFDFGSSGSQQSATPGVFQFSATPAQPQASSAPPGAGFNLSIPQNFNFSDRPITEFSATPEPPLGRKVIKAVRRTKPKRM